MAVVNNTQCDTGMSQENEDGREYPASYPPIPRAIIKEEPQSEEDQDEPDEIRQYVVAYHLLPRIDIKEEVEEECNTLMTYERESIGYQHCVTED